MLKDTSSTNFLLRRKLVPLPPEGKAQVGCRPQHSLKLSAVALFYLPLMGKGDRYPLWVVVDEVLR